MFPVDPNSQNQNQTTFSLTVSKQDGEASETTSLSSTNKEDIMNVLNRFDQIDKEHEYYKDDESCGCPDSAEQGMEVRMESKKIVKENLIEFLSDPTVQGVILGAAGFAVGRFTGSALMEKINQHRNKIYRALKEKSPRLAEEFKSYFGQRDANFLYTEELKRVKELAGMPVQEDADFDYRDEGNGPNNPRDFCFDNDILSFARKGHSKKSNKIVNDYGDNPLPDPSEEETMFESLMEDWENYKGYEENPETYVNSQLRNYREKDLVDIASANLGYPVARQLEDILGVKKSQESLEEQNPNALQQLVQFLRDKDEEDVATEIEQFLHGDEMGDIATDSLASMRTEEVELDENFENKTSIDISGLSGLEINRMVRELERLGLEQGATMFIKSDHPSWISNEKLDYDVSDILGKFGAEEDMEDLDEVSPYLKRPLRSEKEARKDIAKNRASVVGNKQPKGTKDIEGIASSKNKGQKSLGEKSPKGFEGTAKAMKKHKNDIDNPFALSHWMKNKGYDSHYTKGGKKKKD